jgi:hypothetical protein
MYVNYTASLQILAFYLPILYTCVHNIQSALCIIWVQHTDLMLMRGKNN